MEFRLFDSLGFHIGSTAKVLTEHLNKCFAEAGYPIRKEQWILMIRLTESDGINQRALCDECMMDKVQLTRLLDGLEAMNWISRKSDSDDRRNKLIYVTKKGKDSVEELMQVVQNVMQIGRAHV